MGISVIITTYNGEKFIKSQLDSINFQTQKPDEVIIFDDKSNDCTVSIIRNYIKENNLKNWKININEKNIGFSNNFLKAVKTSKENFIFLCDQDDIWYKDKIKNMVHVLVNNPNIVALSSRFETIDENNQKIKWKNKLLNKKSYTIKLLKKIRYQSLSPIGRILGCTMVIRKSAIDLIGSNTNLQSEIGSHDTYLNILASMLGDVYILNQVLVKYRIHSSNTSLHNKSNGGKEERINAIQNRVNFTNYYIKSLKTIGNKKNLDFSHKFMKFEESRIKMLKSSNIFIWLKLILKIRYYYFYSNNILTTIHIYISDLFFILR